MQLYVVGHGIAVESGEIPDEWRPLTDKGRRRFQRTARAFGKLGRRLDLILTSPLVRAVQTAEILASETEPAEVAVLAELDPKSEIEALRHAIALRADKAEAVAIVGDQAQLSAMLAALAGVSPADIDLEDGAIVRVDVSTLTDGTSADPRWWLKPKGTRKKGLPLRKHAGERPAGAESTKPKRATKKKRRRKHMPSKALSPSEPAVDEDESRRTPSEFPVGDDEARHATPSEPPAGDDESQHVPPSEPPGVADRHSSIASSSTDQIAPPDR